MPKVNNCLDIFKYHKYCNQIDLSKPISIFAIDQATTVSGFVGAVFDFSQSMPDIVLVDDISECEKKQIFSVSVKDGPAMEPWPLCAARLEVFSTKLLNSLLRTEEEIAKKYGFIEHTNRCFVCESVFLGRFGNGLSLAKYQTMAVQIALAYGYIPFDYPNANAKMSVGAGGKKDKVTACVNELYGLNIPNTDKCSHFTDAIALATYHCKILLQYKNYKKHLESIQKNV